MLKKFARFFLINIFRPYKLAHFGKGAKVSFPYKILNKKMVCIGDRVSISKNSFIYPVLRNKEQKFQPKIKIGNDVYVGKNAQIIAMGNLTIESDCVISDNVYINDALHSIEPKLINILKGDFYSKGDVYIGVGCFIGYDVAIFSGVSLGDNCIVAAKSVVTKSFPSYSMLAGNPAHIIKKYCQVSHKWIKVQ